MAKSLRSFECIKDVIRAPGPWPGALIQGFDACVLPGTMYRVRRKHDCRASRCSKSGHLNLARHVVPETQTKDMEYHCLKYVVLSSLCG